MTTPDPDDRAAMAAELALGVLDGEARAEALRRMLADPAFAREVEVWRVHFARLFAEWPEAVPHGAVEERVVRGAYLPHESTASRRSAGGRWVWATGVATLIAACLVLALALRPQRVVPVRTPVDAAAAAPLVAAIAPAGTGQGAKPFVAIYDPRIGEVRLAGGVAVPNGRSAQLWAIGREGPPHPLGLLNAGAASRVTLGGRDLTRMRDGVTLAVSIEPAGGSPTGLPTGPVVATGVLARA